MEKVNFKISIYGPDSREPERIPTEKLAAMSDDAVRMYLKRIVTTRNTHIEIDLSGIHEIDNEWFDSFNLFSRLAKKYDSTVVLIGVEPELLEIIELIRKYYFFDIKVAQAV